MWFGSVSTGGLGPGPSIRTRQTAPETNWHRSCQRLRPPVADGSDSVRLLGGLQLVSGLFNITVMSAIQCFGIGVLGGLPGCFAVLLFVVGLAEIGSGTMALLFRNPRWLRPTALLEIVSLAGLGLLSTMVGIVVLVAQRRRTQDLASSTSA